MRDRVPSAVVRLATAGGVKEIAGQALKTRIQVRAHLPALDQKRGQPLGILRQQYAAVVSGCPGQRAIRAQHSGQNQRHNPGPAPVRYAEPHHGSSAREAGVALREDGSPVAGMGADFRDFDNDGLPDLVVSDMLNDTFLLFRNLGKRYQFDDWGERSGIQAGTRPLTGWGLGMYDFDNDGRIDVVVSVLNGPAKLYRNVTANAGHWLAFKLQGTRSNRQGLGAVIRVTLPDGRVLTNHATTSVGYASSSEALVRFGLADQSRADRVEVRWLGGGTQVMTNVRADRVTDVKETPAP